VTVLGKTAASDHFGRAIFRIYDNEAYLDWGARLAEAAVADEGSGVRQANVNVVR